MKIAKTIGGMIMQKGGFDSAVAAREHDYLNRWPFAKEIYGIATTGPRDWSVRIGVYGEWGTGKTSVLNFVRLMANDADHVIVPFNPWQFGSTTDLWRHFVAVVFKRIEQKVGQHPRGYVGRLTKRVLGRAASGIPKFIGIWKKEAATALETGLSYAKRFLAFGPADVRQLEEILGERRILVLIDDLDRTDPKLVPEILFALKEIMDLPGIAFICAFDPGVVGEVLGRFHPGFGDGLKFLDKIIDYPRWLREPTSTELSRLAMADAEQYCPYVPHEPLKNAVCLLPPNPRAVRQFVRLLALLRPQIERHLDHEIHWPILLAANVTKIRFPKFAFEIFANDEFWHSIYQASFDNQSGSQDKRKPIADEEATRLGRAEGLNAEDQADLGRCIWAIAEKLELWFGLPYEGLMYQFYLAERPCAVTWKEFDEFVETVGSRPTAKAVDAWVSVHAAGQGRSGEDVFAELLQATIQGRKTAVARAADAISQAETLSNMGRADTLLQILRILILDLGRIQTKEPRVSAKDINATLESFKLYFSWRETDAYKTARKEEEELLTRIVSDWGNEIVPLLDGFGLNPWDRHDQGACAEWKFLIQRLQQMIQPKLAHWITERLQDSSSFLTTFLHGEDHRYRVREVFLNRNSYLWTHNKSEMLLAVQTASSDRLVRRNVYDILAWFDYVLRKNEPEFSRIVDLLLDREISLAFWAAVVSEPLNYRSIGSLRRFLQQLQQNGFEPGVPEWWSRAIQDLEPPATSEDNKEP